MGYRMTYCIKLTGMVFLLFFAGAPTPFAQSKWQYEGSQYENGLRQAFIEQKSNVLGSICSTRLKFIATQGHGKGRTGILALEFTVSPATSIKGFDFEYFEGPDAPARDRKLMRITVTRNGKRFVQTFYQNGFWSAEVADGFVFETAAITRDKRSEVRKLFDQLRQGAQSIEIAVTDGRNHALVLSAAFPLSDSKPVFEALLKGI
jgi:hypothetical protein